MGGLVYGHTPHGGVSNVVFCFAEFVRVSAFIVESNREACLRSACIKQWILSPMIGSKKPRVPILGPQAANHLPRAPPPRPFVGTVAPMPPSGPRLAGRPEDLKRPPAAGVWCRLCAACVPLRPLLRVRRSAPEELLRGLRRLQRRYW